MAIKSRAGLINLSLPTPSQSGLILDREINDEDIWLIQIGDKKVITNKSACDRLTGKGKVLMRFINKSGTNTEKFI